MPLCKLWFEAWLQLTRSATLHRPLDSWSKHWTVSTPGGEEQALSSRSSVLCRAAPVATWKPAGQVSSGTPNNPCNHRSHKNTVKSTWHTVTRNKAAFVFYLFKLEECGVIVRTTFFSKRSSLLWGLVLKAAPTGDQVLTFLRSVHSRWFLCFTRWMRPLHADILH